MDFGSLLGSVWEPFWRHFGTLFCFAVLYVEFWVSFWGSWKNVRKRSSQGGGGHAICPRRRVFCKGRPLLFWLRFGLHFGVILGARAVTIRILGRLFGKTVSFCQSCFAGVFLVDFGCRPGGVGGWEP